MAHSLPFAVGAALVPALFWGVGVYGALVAISGAKLRGNLQCGLAFLGTWAAITLLYAVSGNRFSGVVSMGGILALIAGVILLLVSRDAVPKTIEVPAARTAPPPLPNPENPDPDELREWFSQHQPSAGPPPAVNSRAQPQPEAATRRNTRALLFGGAVIVVLLVFGATTGAFTGKSSERSSLSSRGMADLRPSSATTEASGGRARADIELFCRGEKRIFDTTGHPKAKGVRLRISYPHTWKAIEGARPNIVQRLVSEDGRGVDMVLIQTRAIPSPYDGELTEGQKQDLFSPEVVKEFVPEGGRLLSHKVTKIDGEPCAMIEFEVVGERVGLKLGRKSLLFIVPRKGVLLMLECGSGGDASSGSARIDQQYAEAKPLFLLMCSSCVLMDKWKTP